MTIISVKFYLHSSRSNSTANKLFKYYRVWRAQRKDYYNRFVSIVVVCDTKSLTNVLCCWSLLSVLLLCDTIFNTLQRATVIDSFLKSGASKKGVLFSLIAWLKLNVFGTWLQALVQYTLKEKRQDYNCSNTLFLIPQWETGKVTLLV